MKLKDIINEGVTDVIARFYKEASDDFDRHYNLEDAEYKDKTHAYYDEYFKEWFAEEIVPVFTKPVTKAQPKYTTKPKSGQLQSPGYRGLQYGKERAGIPFDKNVQGYEPSRGLTPSADVEAFINGQN
jgi:hypothetical protein